jgi:hypothetical protein
MREIIYWVKFENAPKPERIIADCFQDWQDIIARLATRYGQLPEWMVRDYR